jgi:hypothetical protein
MIAGAEITPQVVASARELIARRTSGEITAKAKPVLGPAQAKAKGRARGA